ncbi:MAG: ATP-dependent DNA helicase RecG [Deltaproteobacteria bacterium]|nr:ATP-dependent DNA helicase RecG [Deltaproteobacteria bacterium]
MTAELERRVEALRRPLELAAADGFKGVRKVKGLGHALRAAVDALIPVGDLEGLAAWRVTLAGWEQLDEMTQAMEVARGMRLIARVPRRGAPEKRTGPAVLAPLPDAAKALDHKPAPTLRRSEAPPAGDARAVAPNARFERTDPPHAADAGKPAPTIEHPDAPNLKAAPRATPKAEEWTGDPLAAPTSTLPGIGPSLAAKFAERGLATVEDLLWTLPRRYDDVRGAASLADACAMEEGQRATFVATVVSSRMIYARGRKWAEVRLESVDLTERASAVVRWFNVYGGIEKRMPPGARVALSGLVRVRGGRTEFANPDILGIELADAGPAKPLAAILPRYSDVAGVGAARMRQACAAACARVGDQVDDGVPAHVEAAVGLPSLADTLSALHSPSPEISVDDLAAMNEGESQWQRRLAFGELFALGVAVALRRKQRRTDRAMPCAPMPGNPATPKPSLAAELAKALPFAPTGAQQRSIAELGEDLARDTPMNRLLQGDVGSGKTAVAFAAALQVARAGRQTAVMAPTELLAEQHFETWKQWSAGAKLRIELLTASTPKGVRASLLAMLGAGKIDVLIGTHSLLAEAVGFSALGLVIIDEQHRFGVAQRAKLRDKGDGQGAPHLLVMTATPIPRTLALTAYGDLDVSVLDELPPGRTPVATVALTGARGVTSAYKQIAERVAAGERVYVVCPKIEPGDDDEAADEDGPKRKPWADATSTAIAVAKAVPKAKVGLVHGRLDGAVRDRLMREFKAGQLDVLVATTVIEVGLDVTAATTMVIHDADRFGLAQLHQLRGRVGRGTAASRCVLLTQGTLGDDAKARIAVMVATTDGFRIAEEDLVLRGHGELLGPRQAGAPRLRFGDLAAHTRLLLVARSQAEAILDEDPSLIRPEHAALRRALERRLAHDVYGAEGG